MVFVRFSRFYLLSVICLWAPLSYASEDALDLNEAIQRAWTYSPTIAIANSEIDIRQSEEYQVGLLPNPELSIEIENASSLIRHRKRGCDDRETTYSLSQLIELGGKRSARKQIAAFQSSLAAYEMEAVKLDICNDVTKAVVAVLAAQEYVKLAEEQQRIAHDIHSTTSAKVQGGKISSLQEKKADLARVTTTLALEKGRRALEIAKKKLAATWGGEQPDFSEVMYPLFEITPLIDLATLKAQQSNSVEMMKWDMQIATAERVVANEKAQRVPDVVLTAGYVDGDDGGDGLLLGFSMPIPIFDRNQGNICRAKQQLNQLYEKKNESMLQLRIELEEVYDQLLSAYKEGMAYKENILSSARSAFEAAREEYKRGKNDYLELLDAQRMFFDVQEQYINTLVEYHHRKADVNRLVGGCNCELAYKNFEGS